MFKLLFFILFSSGVFFNRVFSSTSISCRNQTQSFCQEQLGSGGICDQEYFTCECESYFFENDSSKCQVCPGFGGSCEVSGCCGQSLACEDNECVYCMDQYCWLVTSMNEAERERLQRVAQVILAVALLLTGTILFVLFWNACTRRALARQRGGQGQREGRGQGFRMPSNSFQSLTSLQRLMFLRLQDRPPPYNSDMMTQCKNSCEITEPPPSYIEALGLSGLRRGEDNLVFFIEENLQGSNGPSNVSTNNHNNSTRTVENQVNVLPTVPPTTTLPLVQTNTTLENDNTISIPQCEAQNNSRDQNLDVQNETSSEMHI